MSGAFPRRKFNPMHVISASVLMCWCRCNSTSFYLLLWRSSHFCLWQTHTAWAVNYLCKVTFPGYMQIKNTQKCCHRQRWLEDERWHCFLLILRMQYIIYWVNEGIINLWLLVYLSLAVCSHWVSAGRGGGAEITNRLIKPLFSNNKLNLHHTGIRAVFIDS